MAPSLDAAEQMEAKASAAESHGDFNRAATLYQQADYLYREARAYGDAQDMRQRASTARVAALKPPS